MKTALEMAREAGFDVELPAFRDGSAIALKLIEIAQREEREACAKVCEKWIAAHGDYFAEQIRARSM
mgnify:CR=1 FL=1